MIKKKSEKLCTFKNVNHTKLAQIMEILQI